MKKLLIGLLAIPCFAAIQYFTGFESRDFGEVFSTTGTTSIVSSPFHEGYALRVNPTTTGTGYVAIEGLSTSGGLANNVIGSGGAVWVGFAFQYATKPATTDDEFAVVTSSTAGFFLRLTSAGTIAVYQSSTLLVATGATVLSANTPYYIEWTQCCAGTTAGYTLRINGSTELTGTTSLSFGTLSYLTLGKSVNRHGNTVDFYYDDVYIDSAGFRYSGSAPRVSLASVAVGAGNYTAWSNGTGAKNYTQVNELPTDGATSYVESLAQNGVSTFTISTFVAEVGSILAVKSMVALASASGSSVWNIMRTRSGTVDTDTAAGQVPATYGWKQQVLGTDPATTAPWASAPNWLESGSKDDSTVARQRMSTVYAMLLYFAGASTQENRNTGGQAETK